MHHKPGSRLGRYEITGLLGAGGMGDVYQATDTRLKRSVAIKVLRHMDDAESRARFQREAKAIAALHHPNICVIHDAAEADGIDFLVMEYLEGETLAVRLARGPLPPQQLFRCALEIAHALQAAHAHGLVHRDLKPGNIMLTATGTKLLDFGLAKRTDGLAGASSDETFVTRAVAPGEIAAIMGTLGYMAPEQLQGREADARSDVFAFGAILYEMTTGARAFEGRTRAESIAAVLTREPDIRAFDDRPLPQLFAGLVLACLEKDPDVRWQSAADVARALEWIRDSTPVESGNGPPGKRMQAALLGVSAVALASIVALVLLARNRVPSAGGPVRLSVLAPAGTQFTARDITNHPQFALSPDGNSLALVATRQGGDSELWVRALDSGAERPIPGTKDATGPFWAPDGQSLGFIAAGTLKKVSLGGAPPQELAAVGSDVNSGSWSPDGVIIFGGATGDGIYRISQDGGAIAPAAVMDSSRAETGHRWPQFLPDGRHFLYFARSNAPANTGVYLGSLDHDSTKQVLRSASTAVFAEPGQLLYELNGTLVSHDFDVESGQLSGEPVSIGDKVYGLPGSSHFPVSVATTGRMAYWNGLPPLTELLWFDRSGRPDGEVGSEGQFRWEAPTLSRDATRLLVSERTERNRMNLWSFDLKNGTSARLTLGLAGVRFGIWSPNGTEIVYTSSESGVWLLFRRSATGGGAETALPAREHWAMFPEDWATDGRTVVYSATGKTGFDIWRFDLVEQRAEPVIEVPANQSQAKVSPNGRWIAYSSDESGVWEVYVQSFPHGPGRWQVSTDGGSQPVWRGDGRELFYIAADGQVVAAEISGTLNFSVGRKQSLFQSNVPSNLAPYRTNYSVTGDGQRFLLNTIRPDVEPNAISIVINWPVALKTPPAGR